jgi:hypothetical protein
MAGWDDVRRIALGLPGATEQSARGHPSWRIRGRGFVWDRPLRASEVPALGEDAPEGPILGVQVENLGVKEALLADDPSVFFTTPHFDGYPAVLLRLERISVEELTEVIVEAWLCRAPKRVGREYVDMHFPPPPA